MIFDETPQNNGIFKIIFLLFQTCEKSFLNCVGGTPNPQSFRQCINFQFAHLEGCVEGCAPTYNMLKGSEEPQVVKFENFGPGTGIASPRPDSSLCVGA